MKDCVFPWNMLIFQFVFCKRWPEDSGIVAMTFGTSSAHLEVKWRRCYTSAKPKHQPSPIWPQMSFENIYTYIYIYMYIYIYIQIIHNCHTWYFLGFTTIAIVFPSQSQLLLPVLSRPTGSIWLPRTCGWKGEMTRYETTKLIYWIYTVQFQECNTPVPGYIYI